MLNTLAKIGFRQMFKTTQPPSWYQMEIHYFTFKSSSSFEVYKEGVAKYVRRQMWGKLGPRIIELLGISSFFNPTTLQHRYQQKTTQL